MLRRRVSASPSHAGHLVLLRLKDQDYPGVKTLDDWPTWTLPILQWARAQGAVVGFAHSGFGLEVKDTKIPTQEMPRFDGIGANEYIVDVTHDAVDFISMVDTPSPWELNIWYHTLNAGFRTRISGETDFLPCTRRPRRATQPRPARSHLTTIGGRTASACDAPTCTDLARATCSISPRRRCRRRHARQAKSA
jgi:hypothetical protein